MKYVRCKSPFVFLVFRNTKNISSFLLLPSLLLAIAVQQAISRRLQSECALEPKPEKAKEVAQSTEEKRDESWEGKGGESWDQAVQKIRRGLSATEEVFDLLGAPSGPIKDVVLLLALLESRPQLLGRADGSDADADSDAWQEDIAEHQEAYAKALQDLSDLVKNPTLADTSSVSQHRAFVSKQQVVVLEEQLLMLPFEDVQRTVEAFTEAAVTLSKLRALCTSYQGDVSEDVYARIWRMAMTAAHPKKVVKQVRRQAFKVLQKSAFEAVIELQADTAERSMVQGLCPAAAGAARTLLSNRSYDTAEDSNQRLSLLLSILNSPTAPEACGQIYRESDGAVKKTCMCEPGECNSKPTQASTRNSEQASAETLLATQWVCAPCTSQRCSLFWQREQCEVNTGCLDGAAEAQVILGSKLATQELLRRGLYLDPSCNGAIDCLKRRLGHDRWLQFQGFEKTLLAIRRDWLAVSALASVGTALLSYIPKGGTSAPLLEKNVSDVLAGLPKLVNEEQIRHFWGIMKPALLAYRWIRLRHQSVWERASVKGFCARAARELSGMVQVQNLRHADERT